MSNPSISRLKERGGAAGKVTAPKLSKATITPTTEKTRSRCGVGRGDVFKGSAGKENPRPASRVLGSAAAPQKPVMRAMPRIEKPGSGVSSDGEPRGRRSSTSSVPRGRSSSPGEFSSILSDLRKQRSARASVDRCENVEPGSNSGKGLGGVRVFDRIQPRKSLRDANAKLKERALNGSRVRDHKKSEDSVLNLEEISERCDGLKFEVKAEESDQCLRDFNTSGDCDGKANAQLDSENVGDACVSGVLRDCKEENVIHKEKVLKGVEVKEEYQDFFGLKFESVTEKLANGVDLGPKALAEKALDKVRILEGLKENGLSGDGGGVRVCNKYPSKLHEKLAFLEGKVKRIATDIKRTKEMLDMNNPDESKAVLSDIQDKISGLERAMGHVVSSSDGDMNLVKTSENGDWSATVAEKRQEKLVEVEKSSVNGLNSEELEARLFPHHKLIRNRTSLKASSAGSQSYLSHSMETGYVSKIEDKSSNPGDENPIAAEFLVSLNNEQSKVSTRDGHAILEFCEVNEMDGAAVSETRESSSMFVVKSDAEVILTAHETLDEFDDQENRQAMMVDEDIEDACIYQLSEIGWKSSTGGWFVSEGESVLLAHDDGSCSFYDIANCEEKAEYKAPPGVSPNVWRDCWIIRAPGADGCSGRYVVAASAGNTMDSGFCSWDFYVKDVRAFHIEDGMNPSRTVLGPLPNSNVFRRNALSTLLPPENRQWWYKPCGPLIISTASCQRVVRIYDIRDGEQIMKWEAQNPVLAMDYSSPLQWRNRGKVVLAESEGISLWDVSCLNPQALLSIPSSGRKISALHVNNTDAEIGGGVRQRVTSSEAEGNDGVFCTPDSINILDFRHPSGVGLKIPKLGVSVQSVFSRGDSIFLGCSNARAPGKRQSCSQVQQFSLRKQRLVSTYLLPESNAHSHYTAITQVWGNSNLVMGVRGLGLFVFDALKDDVLQSFTMDCGNTQKVREIIGPDDLYSPSFDYLSSRALLISRDRPALWRHLP